METYLVDSLGKLGFTPGNYRVLMLLPLVYVAWADGTMEDVEIERIDAIAKERFFTDTSGLEILDNWLAERPSEEYFRQGLEDLFLLAQTEEGEPLVHAEELHELLSHAEAIARATAHAFDDPRAVTKEEEVALSEVAKLLRVDNGMSWRRLLDDLDAGPASIQAGRAPRSRRS